LAYTDNGDGTITDLNTGLTWEKKSRDGRLHDEANMYVWSGDGSQVTIWDFLDQLNAANFAGHNDWRIPNVKELQSIIDYGTFPAVDPVFNNNCTAGCDLAHCSCTASYYYWSSTTPASATGVALFVDFSGGRVDGTGKGSNLLVRAVRGFGRPSCFDGVQDGSETDIDCGGSCAPCGDFRKCNSSSDCTSGRCQTPTPSLCYAHTPLCIPAHCFDGVQDFNESDVDCGNFCASGCATGKMCDHNNCDCASGACNGTMCQ